MPNTVWFYDTLDLAKFGRADALSVLDHHPGTIVIVKEVYAELLAAPAAAIGSRNALAWLDAHLNDPHYQIDTTPVTNPVPDGGELAIAQQVGAIKGLEQLAGLAGTPFCGTTGHSSNNWRKTGLQL